MADEIRTTRRERIRETIRDMSASDQAAVMRSMARVGMSHSEIAIEFARSRQWVSQTLMQDRYQRATQAMAATREAFND